MQRPKVKAADFIGREAYLAPARGSPRQTVLCTLTVDDHTSASGTKRYMLGGEPILTRDGGTLTDGHGHHPYVTSAGSAPSLGKHVLLAYLPPDQATIGNQLAVSYMEELYPVTVGSVDATAPARPRQRADPMMTLTGPPACLVCVKRVAGLLQRGRADRGRPVRRRPLRRLHDERARGVRGRAGRAGGRRRRRRGDRADPGRRGRRRAAALRAGGRLHRRDPRRRRPAALRPGRRRPRDRGRGARPRGAGPRRTTWSCSATTPPTAATSRSASGSPTSSAGRSSTASRTCRVEDGEVTARRRPVPTATRPTGCRCRPWSRSSRAASSRATRRCRAGCRPRRWRSRSASRSPSPPDRSRVRLLLPPPAPSDVQILGQGRGRRARRRRPPRAAGGAVAMILVLVETDAVRRRRGVPRGDHVRPLPVRRRRRRARRRRRGRRGARPGCASSSRRTASAPCTTPSATPSTAYARRRLGAAVQAARATARVGRGHGRRDLARQRGAGPRRRPRRAWRWRPTCSRSAGSRPSW